MLWLTLPKMQNLDLIIYCQAHEVANHFECHFTPYADSSYIWNLVTHRKTQRAFFPNEETVSDNLVANNASFSELQRITN